MLNQGVSNVGVSLSYLSKSVTFSQPFSLVWYNYCSSPSNSFSFLIDPVSTITIQPLSSTYQTGDSITCITDGYPKASILWFDSYRPTDTWSGETLPITSSMLGSKNWTCRASQTISYKGNVVDQPVSQKYFTFDVLPGGAGGYE